jgi:hypothetical protein
METSVHTIRLTQTHVVPSKKVGKVTFDAKTAIGFTDKVGPILGFRATRMSSFVPRWSGIG